MKKKPFSELVIGVACMALGVAVFIAAGSLQKVKLGIGPAGMPKFVAVLLMVLGLAQTVTAVSTGVKKPEFKVDKKAASLFAAAVVMSVVYVLLVDTIGFIIMTPLLLIGLMWLFGERNIVKMLIIAAITTVCIWLLFTKVFMIFLPVGRIFR